MDLLAARSQMALTLGFHIVLACYGVGLPVLLLFAEGRYLATKDEAWRTLARRWSKAFAVLFAVGAVSGTVLSFELGLLWPKFMGTFGAVIGLPFTLEAFAFFLEAIFVGIYLYAWDRLPPRAHWLCGFPVAIAGLASAWFVVTANAWMNTPQGFVLENGVVTEADPWVAMMNPATWAQTTHMILAAYIVTGPITHGGSCGERTTRTTGGR
jgi:cytochrome bd ubiquinol oxidase subunit I